MGRRAHQPDPTSRRQVEAMAAYGVPETDIATVIAVDPKTLRKHYRAELDTGEIKANSKVADAEKAPRSSEYSDNALALRLADAVADDARWIEERHKWMLWDGQRWLEDKKLEMFSRARDVAREAAAEVDTPKQAAAIRSRKTIAAIEGLAKSDRRLVALSDQWDADHWTLNTPTGTVDLRTGKVRPHSPTYYMTKMTAVGAGTECPTWLAFLSPVTDNDDALVEFIRRMCGYCLTGDTSEHALFFLFGHGANGKSVLLNTISGILGDYAWTTAIETFTVTHTESHPTGLAALQGVRLVTAAETEEGRPWAESRIKALTGGDRISARFMRQDYFNFYPVFKLTIAGNHKPALRSVDEAFRRRFNLVPFAVTIPPEERDPELTDKLRAEWPGILQWMIDGCLEWQASGLGQPASVTEATAAYLEGEDALMAWIDDRCVRDPSARTKTSELFLSWSTWASQSGEASGSRRLFTQTMDARGFQRYRDGGGRGFTGLKLRSNRPTEDRGT